MVVLTSGNGLEHALVIRRGKKSKNKNQVEPEPTIEAQDTIVVSDGKTANATDTNATTGKGSSSDQ
jgi:hypothetical protein